MPVSRVLSPIHTLPAGRLLSSRHGSDTIAMDTTYTGSGLRPADVTLRHATLTAGNTTFGAPGRHKQA